MKRLAYCAVACVTLLLISACGGGGGGGSPTSTMPTTPTPSSPTTDTAFSSNPSTSADAAHQAATATPAFGSVTQSSNVNVSGITTDAAQVTVSGERITLRVRRRDGSGFSLNTVDHLVDSSGVVTSPVTGRSWQSGLLFDYDADSFTVMRGAIDYSSDDITDWMAGGYWLHARGNLDAGIVSAVEVGAFVDSPEISGPANVPVSGTATYNGIAAGLYASQYGSDVPGEQAGTIELGEYSGSFRAVADFSRGTVSGSVSNVVVDGVVTEPNGTVYAGYGPSPVRLELGPTSINSNGTFTGTDVRLIYPGFSFVHNEGSWGGRFSTIDDRAGDPRAVAGTHGGAATTSGGTEIVFTGAQFGATPSF
ncbi:MAG: hypothetical protein OXF33_05820 [Rhodospirillales bacterium]|nr:hypothetical protein [Rhodospirillales bacterium]